MSLEILSRNDDFAENKPCDSVCPAGEVVSTAGPITSDPKVKDTDGDGLTDREEFELVTDPQLADTDGDGLWDKVEVDGFTMAPFGTMVPGTIGPSSLVQAG